MRKLGRLQHTDDCTDVLVDFVPVIRIVRLIVLFQDVVGVCISASL